MLSLLLPYLRFQASIVIFSDCTDSFVSDLDGIPEDMFSRYDATQIALTENTIFYFSS